MCFRAERLYFRVLCEANSNLLEFPSWKDLRISSETSETVIHQKLKMLNQADKRIEPKTCGEIFLKNILQWQFFDDTHVGTIHGSTRRPSNVWPTCSSLELVKGLEGFFLDKEVLQYKGP